MKKTTSGKVGRPPLPEKEKLGHYLCLNVTQGEMKAIECKAKEMKVTKSTLVRMAIHSVI